MSKPREDPEKSLRRILQLQRDFKRLYETTPLIGVFHNSAQIRFKDFELIAPRERWTISDDGSEIYPIRIATVISGVEIHAVTKREEAKAAGFVLPEAKK